MERSWLRCKRQSQFGIAHTRKSICNAIPGFECHMWRAHPGSLTSHSPFRFCARLWQGRGELQRWRQVCGRVGQKAPIVHTQFECELRTHRLQFSQTPRRTAGGILAKQQGVVAPPQETKKNPEAPRFAFTTASLQSKSAPCDSCYPKIHLFINHCICTQDCKF